MELLETSVSKDLQSRLFSTHSSTAAFVRLGLAQLQPIPKREKYFHFLVSCEVPVCQFESIWIFCVINQNKCGQLNLSFPSERKSRKIQNGRKKPSGVEQMFIICKEPKKCTNCLNCATEMIKHDAILL